MRIIVSDGGPGHFKVYKTQFWMSSWDEKLRKKNGIRTEWNMYFANLGHNLCDGHAGKMKVYDYFILVIFFSSQSHFLCSSYRQVREVEGNYNAMVTAADIINAVEGKIRNTLLIQFDASQIDACDEENVEPVGKGFIKKYHHFSYGGAGIVKCRYIKGVGPYSKHSMIQGAGVWSEFFFFFFFFSFFHSHSYSNSA